MAAEAERSTLPRPLLAFGVPVAGFLLVALFVHLGFPYALLADRIAGQIRRSEGVRLDIAELGPSLHFAGPGLEAAGVRATLSGGETVHIERAVVRPAWSLAWLRGVPAVHAEIESEFGRAEGMLLVGSERGWSGDLEQVDLAKLPLSLWAPVGRFAGVLDASVDVRLGEKGPEGQASFEARDGSLGLPNFPLDIPFEKLTGELVFGGDAAVAIEQAKLEGPLVRADVTGNVLQANDFARSPLRLEVDLQAEPAIIQHVRRAGVRVDQDGKAKVRITGTLDQPRVR